MEQTPLAALAGYRNGFAFKPDDRGVEGLPIVRIEQLLNPSVEPDLFAGEVPATNRIADGDLVFSWSGTLAVRFWSRGPAYLNQHLFRVEPRPGVNKQWLRWALEEAIERMKPLMHGTAMTHITRRVLEETRVPLPPVEQQQRIADYLDTETARIDALIEKVDDVQKLLDERRTSTASELLDESAPKRPLRYCLTQFIGGDWGSEAGVAEHDVRVYRAADFDRVRHVVRHDRAPVRSVSSTSLRNRELCDGDVIIEKSGGGEHQPVGCAVVYRTPPDGAAAISSNFNARLVPAPDVDSEYLNLLLAALYRTRQTRPFINQTTGIQNLDLNSYLDMSVPVPVLPQQRRIAIGVLAVWDRLDQLAASINEQTRLLQERRQALITAAVTGEVEV